MPFEDKSFSSQVKTSAFQKIFNLLCVIIFIILSVCIACMYWQLHSLQKAALVNTEVIQRHATHQEKESTYRGDRVKRQAGGVATTPSSFSVIPAAGRSGHAEGIDDHHQRRQLIEQMEKDISALAEANQRYSAHMVMCERCFRNHTRPTEDFYETKLRVDIYPQDYARWVDAGVQGDNNRSVPVLHTLHSLSTPTVPEDGLYHVYGQITWQGRPNATQQNLENPAHRNTLFSIVTLPEEHSRDRETELLSSLSTQFNLGMQLNISYRGANSHPGDYPIDSSFVSGNFYLRSGQLIAIRLGRSAYELDFGRDKSFFGYYQLQKY